MLHTPNMKLTPHATVGEKGARQDVGYYKLDVASNVRWSDAIWRTTMGPSGLDRPMFPTTTMLSAPYMQYIGRDMSSDLALPKASPLDIDQDSPAGVSSTRTELL